MRNLSQVIGWYLLREKLLDLKLLNIELIEKNNNLIIKTRIFETDYNFKLNNFLWGKLETVYETIITSEMLIQGYLLITIEEGWLVVNPHGENYQIEKNNYKSSICTCGDFLYHRKQQSRCKHLIFKDWHLNYRKRIVEYKSKL